MIARLLILLVLFFAGCGPSRVPEFSVVITEQKDSAKIVIAQFGNTITLDTIEEVRSFREEVEFLLLKLNEVDDKMEIKEFPNSQ
jgi:hypothetical protein